MIPISLHSMHVPLHVHFSMNIIINTSALWHTGFVPDEHFCCRAINIGSLRRCQAAADAEHLIPCNSEEWKTELRVFLSGLGYSDVESACSAVEKFANASCMIISPRGFASGTLIGPERGVIVTNNHVLKKGDKKKRVVFNYTEDGNIDNCIEFGVEEIVSFSQPLQDLRGNTNFDYSFCKLNVERATAKEERVLKSFAVSDQSVRCEQVQDPAQVPLVMFGHPKGLTR